MTDLEPVDDPRIHEDICGVTITPFGIERICIREPHLKVYRVKRRSRRGEVYEAEQDQSPPRPGETVQGDRHYFVRRWQHRSVPN